MDEKTFKKLIADNIIYYRKRCGLTQAMLAERINYSDKSVSKWERAEGLPDAFVLMRISEIFGVPLAYIVSERGAEAPDEGDSTQSRVAEAPEKPACHSAFSVLLAVGGLWLVATTVFSVLNMLATPVPRAYLAFVYAIPFSFLIVELFAVLWKLPAILHLMSLSATLWTVALSVQLSVHIENFYLIYVIAAVAQLLGMFGFGLYLQMIPHPRKGWWKFWRNRG